MGKLNVLASLNNIEKNAQKKFGMKVPEYSRCRVLKINKADKEKLNFKKNKKHISFIAYLKEVFSVKDAQAR